MIVDELISYLINTYKKFEKVKEYITWAGECKLKQRLLEKLNKIQDITYVN